MFIRKGKKKFSTVLALVLTIVMVGSTGLLAFADLENQNAPPQEEITNSEGEIAGQARNDEGAVSDEGAVGDEDSISDEDSESDIAGDEVSGDNVDSSDTESDADTDATQDITQQPNPTEKSSEDVAITILADDPTEVYVSDSGSDSNGEGTTSKPFATLEKAFDVASSDNPVTVFLMSDIEISTELGINVAKGLTIKSNDTNVQRTIKRSAEGEEGEGYTGILLNISDDYELTLENITIDGNKGNVDALHPLIDLTGKLTLSPKSVIKDNKNTTTSSNYGGGIALNGDTAELIIDGGTVSGNEALIGSGIYYGGGKLTVKGTPKVGTSDADNGIYINVPSLNITIDGTLAGASRVNIDGKNGAQVSASIAQTKSGDAAAVTGFTWLTRAYNIVADDNKLILSLNETENTIGFYVDGQNGNDTNADGSIDKPFKTMTALMRVIPRGSGVAVRVVVKDITPIDQSILINNYKKLTIEGWSEASAGQEPKLIRTDGFTDRMLQAPENKELVVKDITLDGNSTNGMESLVYIDGGTFTQTNSIITNNYAFGSGGGVFLSDGTYNINGGKVIGNKANTGTNGSGADVYYFGGQMHITGGNPVIGTGTKTGNPANTIYDGLSLGAGKFIYLDTNLLAPAKIYLGNIEGAADGRVIVEKSEAMELTHVSTIERKLFPVPDNSYSTKTVEPNKYVLGVAEYYVANPAGAYLGNDSNSGTEEAPFATLKKALDTAKANTVADIYIMDDIDVNEATATLDSATAKTINLKKWNDPLAADTITLTRKNANTWVTVTGAHILNVSDLIFDGANRAGSDSFFNVQINNVTTENPKLNLKNTVLKNNTGITPAIDITRTPADNTKIAGSITIDGGGIYDCSSTANGGAIAVRYFTVTLKDTTITGNTSAGKGNGIYVESGTLNYGGNVHIGMNAGDNGIYAQRAKDNNGNEVLTNGNYAFAGTIRINAGLTDAWVNYEFSPNAYAGADLAVKSTGTTTPEEAAMIHYLYAPFNVVQKPASTNTYMLENRTEWYVASESGSFLGSDSYAATLDAGLGTKERPFASLARAFELTGLSPTNVYVMDDIVISKTAKVLGLNSDAAPASQRKITVSGNENAPYTVTRNGNGSFLGYFFDLNYGTSLILNDLTYDGNGSSIATNANPIIFIQSPGSKIVAKTTVTLNSGTLKNNKSKGSGGAVLMESTEYDGSRSTFTVNGGEISGNYAAIYGGGIYSGRGSALIINDGSVIKNNKSGTENGFGNNLRSTIGNDIYALQRTAAEFTVNGKVEIGTRATGEGIYLAFNTSVTSKNMLAGTDITFEFRYLSAHNNTIVTNGATTPDANKTVNNEEMFSYFPQVYSIEYNATDKNYHLIANRDIYYVSQTIGDDILGDGSIEHPLYTIPLAFRAVQAGRVSEVIVMDDNSLKTQAVKASGKAITVKGWSEYSATEEKPYPVVTNSSVGAAMFSIDVEAATTAEANRLIMKDLILDGASANYPIVNIGTTGGSNTTAKFEMQNGRLQNYVETAVMVNGGTGSYTSQGVFRMLGGEIGGVKATKGYAVRLNAASGRATIELAGSPVIGYNGGDGGVHLGNDSVAGKMIVLNGSGATDNLKDGASINFAGPDLEQGTLIAKDATETDLEVEYFHSKTFRIIPTGDGDKGYIIESKLTDCYVASPDGDYHGSDIDGDGSIAHPFETIALAMSLIPVKQECNIYVLDDIDIDTRAALTNNKIATVSTAPEADRVFYQAGTDPEIVTATRATGYGYGASYTDSNASRARGAIFELTGNAELTLKNFVINGNKAVDTIACSVAISANNSSQINMLDGFHFKNWKAIALNMTSTTNEGDAASILASGDSSSVYPIITLNGGKVTDCESNDWEYINGAAFFIRTNARMYMLDGEISGNRATNTWAGAGSGAAVVVNSFFEMSGGKISNNTTCTSLDSTHAPGGAVKVNGTFNMRGGEISGNFVNVAYWGEHRGAAGVTLYAGAMNLSGGKIINNVSNDGNYVERHIGGIWIRSGATLNMSGGEVSGSTGRDIGVQGTFNVGGTAKVGKDSSREGVYLDGTAQVINVTGDLSDEAKISVKMKTSAAVGTIIAVKKGSPVKLAEGKNFRWIPPGAVIEQDESVEANLVLKAAPIYVSEKIGNDATGYGTVENPFKSFACINDVPTLFTADIYVMDDITLSSTVELSNRKVNFNKWDGASGEVKIKRANTFSYNMLKIIGGSSLINIGELTFDGFQGTGAVSGNSAAAVTISAGTLNLRGTKIVNNYTANANGGWGMGLLISGGTVHMYDGEISGNHNNSRSAGGFGRGGGVSIESGNGKFYLHGGSIIENKGELGGGVYVGYDATFYMDGGLIEGNKAARFGGGVYIVNTYTTGVADISGGIITGNTAPANNGGAIYVHDANGKLILSGNPIIGYDKSDNGIFLNGAATTIKQKADFGPDTIIVLEGKTSAVPGTIVAERTPAGDRATMLESGYFIWKDATYRVIPAGNNQYKLVSLVEYYISGQDGTNFPNVVGTKDNPFKTIEYALSLIPQPGVGEEPVAAVIHVMDDDNGLDTSTGFTIYEGQNIVLQRQAGKTSAININRGNESLAPMFTIEEGATLEIRDLNINGRGIAGAGPIVLTEGLFMMYSGSLQNNKSVGTAAVEISGSLAAFELYGGNIRNNVSTGSVGAVNINGGTFTMNGGEISGNKSATSYGAITLGADTAKFIMLGGEIKNNNEYAVLFKQGSVSMGGSAKIGLTKKDNGIYLGEESVITLLSNISKNNRINIAGKDEVELDGTSRGTILVNKTGGAAVNAVESLNYYWQPGYYSVDEGSSNGKGNTYILGYLKAAFIDARPDGALATKTTTKITLEFDTELPMLRKENITLMPELVDGTDNPKFTIKNVSLSYARIKPIINPFDPDFEELHYLYDLFVSGDWEDGDVLKSIKVVNSEVVLTPNTITDRTLYRDITDYTVTFIGNADDIDSVALVEGATSVARLVPDIGMSIMDASTDKRVLDEKLEIGIPSDVSYAGHKFLGWSTDPDGLSPSTEFTEDTQISGDTFVYAIWYKYKTFAISFEGNGADDALWQQIKSITEPSTKLDGLPLPPERFGYTFTGWNTKADGSGSVFDLDSLVTSDGSVYAQWSKNPDPPTPPVPPTPPTPPTPPVPPTPPTPPTPPLPPVDTPETPTTPSTPTDVTPVVDPDTDDTTIVITRADADNILARANGIAAGIGSSVSGSIKSVGGNISQIIENFQDGNVPASAGVGENAWAFLNLIFAIIGVALVLVTLFVKIAKRRNDERIEDEYGHTDDEHKRKTLRWFIAAILLGVIGVVLFCLTEDMSLPMVWFDKWTMVQAAILALGLVSTFFANRRDEKEEEVTYV